MERNERLDEIMTCSKEAIALVLSWYCRESGACTVGLEKCPFKGVACGDVTPQDWEKALNERNGGESCITE